MKLIIDIDDNVFTRLFDNGVDISMSDAEKLATTIRKGEPYERPTGHWESVGFVNMKYAWFRCSNCHKTTKIYMDSSNDFCCISDIRNKAVACLFCGADMRGGRE